MRYITDYELSDIPEEEGPEQVCTDFDRKDGKYLAIPSDVGVIARPRVKSTVSLDKKISIRKKIIQRQERQNEKDDDTNAAYIKRL